MIPAVIAPVLLRRLSPGRLRALSLGARAIDAAEARALGLADEVAKAADLPASVSRQVGRLTRSSPDAIAQTKSYLDWLGDDPLQTSLERALGEISAWLRQPHVVEGARAFADGLAPAWFSRREASPACRS
jgi:methylglutaconyl-CoA hydratase